jgi:hypothetical protein
VFRAGEAPVEGVDQGKLVFLGRRLRIEPEPGEDPGAVQPILIRPDRDEPPALVLEPSDGTVSKVEDQVFPGLPLLVVPELVVQVDRPRAQGDLDDQLGCPVGVVVLAVSRLAPVRFQDQQGRVRLRLALLPEDRRGVVLTFGPRRRQAVIEEPAGDHVVRPAVPNLRR